MSYSTMAHGQNGSDDRSAESNHGSSTIRGWTSLVTPFDPDQLPQAPSSFLMDQRDDKFDDSVENLIRHDQIAVQGDGSYNSWPLRHSSNEQEAESSVDPDSQQVVHPYHQYVSLTPAEPGSVVQAEQNSMWISPYRTPSVEPFSSYDHGDTFTTTRLPLPPQTVEYEGRARSIGPPMQIYPDLSSRFLNTTEDAGHQDLLDSQPAATDTSDTEPLDSGTSGRASGRKRKATTRATDGRRRKKRIPDTRQQPRSKVGGQLGIRTALDPSQEFTTLYNAAREALLDEGNAQKAQGLVLQAIAVNPEIFAAHSLLADIHYLRGHNELAVDTLMTGLHGHGNEVELWRNVADTILDNPHESQQKKVERAMYCFSAIIRKEPKDLDARYQRAECARELRQYNKSIMDFEILLQEDPNNSTILAAYMRLCVEINDAPKARKVYEALFDHFAAVGLCEESHYTWQDVGNYCDLISMTGDTELAILKFRQLARALSGREDEQFWDEMPEDDREFDQDHVPRRVEISDFELDRHPVESYGMALPLDLRGKLGILRLKLNFRDEAITHFSWLRPDDRGENAIVHEYFDMYWEVGRALYEAEEHAQALAFFDALHDAEIDLGIDFWQFYAKSSQRCNRIDEAISYLQKVVGLDPENIDARTSISELYILKGDRITALKYGREAVTRAQENIPINAKQRKYERREQRLVREAAERALRNAYRMPKLPGAKPRKLPAELKARSRFSRAWRRTNPDFLRDSIQPGEQGVSNDVEGVDFDGPTKKKGGPPTRVRPPPPPYASSAKQVRAASVYDEMQQRYATIINCQEAMRNGDEFAMEIWTEAAQAMVDHFRTVKAIFPTDKRKYEGFNSYEPAPEPSPGHVSQLEISNAEWVPRLVSPSLPDSYCGIPYALWLDIHLELALIISLPSTARTATSQQQCYSVLNTALAANVFHHHLPSLTQIHICYLSCALNFSDEPTVFSLVLRWFMRTFAYCTDAYRLFTAINYLYEYPAVRGGKTAQLDKTVFKSGPSQKFIFRQLTSLDAALPDDYGVGTKEGPVPQFMRLPREGIRRDAHLQPPGLHNNGKLISQTTLSTSPPPDRNDYRSSAYSNTRAVPAHEMDAVLFILYAHIMMASNSYPNALSYLYRAYSLDRTNPVCLLSLALCYMQQLFKRQNEKRHQWALMGWAWFGKYEDARRAFAEEQDRLTAAETAHQSISSIENGDGGQETKSERTSCRTMADVIEQEIAFNRARCWEMLGMSDLALRGYQGSLTMRSPRKSSGKVMIDGDSSGRSSHNAEDEDWTMEAAYSMSTIYARNGDARQARHIVEKYLVVE